MIRLPVLRDVSFFGFYRDYTKFSQWQSTTTEPVDIRQKAVTVSMAQRLVRHHTHFGDD
jgi:hypothetical protein